MPTGGVEPTAESIRQWLQAGVVALGMGSKLITADILKTGSFPELKEKVELMLGIIEGVSC